MGEKVFALDGQNGHILWNQSGLYAEFIPLISDNMVYLATDKYTSLLAVDALTGATRWTSEVSLVGIAPGKVYGTDHQYNILALSSTDGQLLWKIPYTPQSQIKLFVAGDIPYLWQADASDVSGSLAALTPATGRVLWKTSLPASVGMVAYPYDGLVFAFGGTPAGVRMYALDAVSGRLRWQVSSSPNTPNVIQVLDCGTNILCLAYSDGSITAVNSQDGTALWHFTYGAPIPSGEFFTPLTFAQNGNSVLVTTPQHLAVVDIESGTLRWQRDFATSAALSLSGTYPFQRGTLYVNAAEDQAQSQWHIEALDAKTGKSQWEVSGAESAAGYPLLLGDELINAPGNSVIAYDSANGSIAWQTTLPGSQQESIEFLSVALVSAGS
jgi:outer membrane protein assembly factor BamB